LISQIQEKTDDWQNIFPTIGGKIFRWLAKEQYNTMKNSYAAETGVAHSAALV